MSDNSTSNNLTITVSSEPISGARNCSTLSPGQLSSLTDDSIISSARGSVQSARHSRRSSLNILSNLSGTAPELFKFLERKTHRNSVSVALGPKSPQSAQSAQSASFYPPLAQINERSATSRSSSRHSSRPTTPKILSRRPSTASLASTLTATSAGSNSSVKNAGKFTAQKAKLKARKFSTLHINSHEIMGDSIGQKAISSAAAPAAANEGSQGPNSRQSIAGKLNRMLSIRSQRGQSWLNSHGRRLSEEESPNTASQHAKSMQAAPWSYELTLGKPSSDRTAEELAKLYDFVVALHVSFFEKLGNNMLRLLCTRLKMQEVGAGEYLFKQGDKADTFYVILQGKVAVLIDPTINNNNNNIINSNNNSNHSSRAQSRRGSISTIDTTAAAAAVASVDSPPLEPRPPLVRRRSSVIETTSAGGITRFRSRSIALNPTQALLALGNISSAQQNGQISAIQCLSCLRFGHYAVNCPNNSISPQNSPSGTARGLGERRVASLEPYSCFGEVSLTSSEAIRQASIKTLLPCKLLALNRNDYCEAVQQINQANHVEKLEFLKGVYLFKLWSAEKLFNFSLTCNLLQLNNRQVLYKQGDHANFVYFIASGAVKLVYCTRENSMDKHFTQFPGEKIIELLKLKKPSNSSKTLSNNTNNHERNQKVERAEDSSIPQELSSSAVESAVSRTDLQALESTHSLAVENERISCHLLRHKPVYFRFYLPRADVQLQFSLTVQRAVDLFICTETAKPNKNNNSWALSSGDINSPSSERSTVQLIIDSEDVNFKGNCWYYMALFSPNKTEAELQLNLLPIPRKQWKNCSLIRPEHSYEIAILANSQIFGLHELLGHTETRIYSAVATANNTKIYAVSKEDFLHYMRNYAIKELKSLLIREMQRHLATLQRAVAIKTQTHSATVNITSRIKSPLLARRQLVVIRPENLQNPSQIRPITARKAPGNKAKRGDKGFELLWQAESKEEKKEFHYVPSRPQTARPQLQADSNRGAGEEGESSSGLNTQLILYNPAEKVAEIKVPSLDIGALNNSTTVSVESTAPATIASGNSSTAHAVRPQSARCVSFPYNSQPTSIISRAEKLKLKLQTKKNSSSSANSAEIKPFSRFLGYHSKLHGFNASPRPAAENPGETQQVVENREKFFNFLHQQGINQQNYFQRADKSSLDEFSAEAVDILQDYLASHPSTQRRPYSAASRKSENQGNSLQNQLESSLILREIEIPRPSTVPNFVQSLGKLEIGASSNNDSNFAFNPSNLSHSGVFSLTQPQTFEENELKAEDIIQPIVPQQEQVISAQNFADNLIFPSENEEKHQEIGEESAKLLAKPAGREQKEEIPSISHLEAKLSRRRAEFSAYQQQIAQNSSFLSHSQLFSTARRIEINRRHFLQRHAAEPGISVANFSGRRQQSDGTPRKIKKVAGKTPLHVFQASKEGILEERRKAQRGEKGGGRVFVPIGRRANFSLVAQFELMRKLHSLQQQQEIEKGDNKGTIKGIAAKQNNIETQGVADHDSQLRLYLDSSQQQSQQ
jgi:CRP-like cAMP-binding protein